MTRTLTMESSLLQVMFISLMATPMGSMSGGVILFSALAPGPML